MVECWWRVDPGPDPRSQWTRDSPSHYGLLMGYPKTHEKIREKAKKTSQNTPVSGFDNFNVELV
jgi:hypothetical protein